MARHLYLARYGDQLKVGISTLPEHRLATHRSRARRAGIPFEVLALLPEHEEAAQNERAVIARFGTRGSLSEYLDADADEVLAFMRTLPRTPPTRTTEIDSERWLRKAEVAEMLQVGVQTVDRYVKLGHLKRYYTWLPRRPVFRIEDVRALEQTMWVAR